jgi:hypothetical protein
MVERLPSKQDSASSNLVTHLYSGVKAVMAKLASQDVPNVQALGSNPGDRNENEANECQTNMSSVHLLSKKSN